MKTILLTLLCASTLVWAAEEKKVEKPAEKPAPIIVNGTPSKIAEIDPVTLKVTYAKGADPKVFADSMVKAWANAMSQLEQCQKQQKNEEKK